MLEVVGAVTTTNCTLWTYMIGAGFDRWTTTNLSVARWELAATSVGPKALFAGGRDFTSDPPTLFNVVDIYDLVTDSWTMANLSVARYDLVATSLGTKAFFAGGTIKGYGQSNVVDICDWVTDTWASAKLSYPRNSLSAASVRNKALFGGATDLFALWGWLIFTSKHENELMTLFLAQANLCLGKTRKEIEEKGFLRLPQ